MSRWAYAAIPLCAPLAAWSHAGEPHAEGAWEGIWNSEALILANLLTLSALYGIGWYRRRTWSGGGAARLWGPWCFAGSMVALLVALLSPVAELSEKLGWVHMIQHTALMMVAAPLFVLGSPGSHMSSALPGSWRRVLWRRARLLRKLRLPHFQVSQPILIWLLFALSLWTWHVPLLYEGALRSSFIHDLQHLTFFLTAALFWQALLHPIRRRRLNQGLGVLYLFLASIHSTALGVLMALSPVAWYPFYEATAPALGFSALADQQIAGYIMWMPACMMYAAIAIALCASWLSGLRDPLPGRHEGHVQGA